MTEETPYSRQLPPEGEIVFTVIDDANGRRNEALLRRRKGLHFFPDESMYVYYTPTHWRPATLGELNREREKLVAKAASEERLISEMDRHIQAVQSSQS